jgi:hypothetical protein
MGTAGSTPGPGPDFPPKEFNEIPIVLFSIHGRYSGESMFTVPPNTWIFETAGVGDLCLVTVDKPLWKLVQGKNRERFLAYLKGEEDPSNSPELREKFKDVISQLNYYEPGDSIYERDLVFTEKDEDMDFYLFPRNRKYIRPDKTAIFMNHVRKQIIKSGQAIKTGTLIRAARETNPELQNGCIFIISACGAITPNLYRKFGTKIETHERNQMLKFMEYTSAASPGAVSKPLPDYPNYGYSLRSPTSTVPQSVEKIDHRTAMSRPDIGINKQLNIRGGASSGAAAAKRLTKACAKICPCSPDVGDCYTCMKQRNARSKNRFRKTQRKRK